MEEIKAFYWIAKRWALIMGGIILLCAFVYSLSSCSGSRHMQKSESKTDFTSVVKTETSKDSIVNTSKESKTETVVNNDIKSEDSYTEETTETTKLDTAGKPIEKVTTKKRTGKLSTSDATKTNITENVKDTTASHSTENQKTDNKTKVAKEESSKKVDAEHSILSRGNVIIFALALLIIVVGIWAYKKFVK